jgi:hypothetical protein
VLTNVTDTEPMTRNATIRSIAEQRGSIEVEEFSNSHAPLCAQHANGLGISQDHSVHLASQLQSLCNQAAGGALSGELAFLQDRSGRGLRDRSGRGWADLSGRFMAARDAPTSLRPAMTDLSARGPRLLDRALERATGDLIEVLNQGSGVELWCENR